METLKPRFKKLQYHCHHPNHHQTGYRDFDSIVIIIILILILVILIIILILIIVILINIVIDIAIFLATFVGFLREKRH